MLAQEILLRAVGKNTEADIVKAGIEYSKNSKNSEADRIANSIKVTTQASKALESVDSLKSGGLSAEGKVLYVKSFPSAIKGLKATIQLVPVSKTMVAGVSANPMSAFKELGGVAKIIPKIPGYISNVTSVPSDKSGSAESSLSRHPADGIINTLRMQTPNNLLLVTTLSMAVLNRHCISFQRYVRLKASEIPS